MTVPDRFRVLESLVVPKGADDEAGEDVLVDGPDFVVVSDGVTDDSGMLFGGVSGGRRVADIVCGVVGSAHAGTSAAELLARINEAYAADLGPSVSHLPGERRPAASFCALDKAYGRIVRVGDTMWRTGAREFATIKEVDRINAEARSALLQSLLVEGARLTSLATEDPGRAMIEPLLRSQSVWRNRDVDNLLAYGAIDGRPVPGRFIEEWQLDDTETEVVLASDGYPALFMSLAATEDYLRADLAADPLRIFRHPTTKAVRPGSNSFDDRTYVRLARTAG